VTYGYDAAGEPTSVTDSSSVLLMQWVYDDLGRIKSIPRAAGAQETRAYGADLRLRAQSFSFGDTSKNVNFNYTYNLAGQPLSVTADNAIYRSTISHAATAYATDGQNRYTSEAGNSLAYDSRANTTSTGAASGFIFDGLNRMIHQGSQTTLGYDAVGRLNIKVDHTTGQLTSCPMGRKSLPSTAIRMLCFAAIFRVRL